MVKLNFTQSLKTTADAIKPCNTAGYEIRDGYDWMELQNALGLWSNPAFGDWPYIVYANGKRNDTFIIREFQEHDVKTWWYSDDKEGREEYAHHLEQLKTYWQQRQKELNAY